jgi:putative transcriptional regulator
MSVFNEIMNGLQEAIEHEQGRRKLRTKSVKVLPTPDYNKDKVKEIRINFGMSQAVFADVIGVSTKTVEAWESGRNKPDRSTSRLLQIMEKNPKIMEEHGLLVRK